jgi:hypothetical protein
VATARQDAQIVGEFRGLVVAEVEECGVRLALDERFIEPDLQLEQRFRHMLIDGLANRSAAFAANISELRGPLWGVAVWTFIAHEATVPGADDGRPVQPAAQQDWLLSHALRAPANARGQEDFHIPLCL